MVHTILKEPITTVLRILIHFPKEKLLNLYIVHYFFFLQKCIKFQQEMIS